MKNLPREIHYFPSNILYIPFLNLADSDDSNSQDQVWPLGWFADVLSCSHLLAPVTGAPVMAFLQRSQPIYFQVLAHLFINSILIIY